jgi:hypothetical protein
MAHTNWPNAAVVRPGDELIARPFAPALGSYRTMTNTEPYVRRWASTTSPFNQWERTLSKLE